MDAGPTLAVLNCSELASLARTEPRSHDPKLVRAHPALCRCVVQGHLRALLNLLAPKFISPYAFITSALLVHFRGTERHRLLPPEW